MKTLRTLLILLCIASIVSCSSDDNNGNQQDQFANFQPQSCTNGAGVLGVRGLYWDYSNAVPVPLTQIPTIVNPGDFFIHSGYPQLGFQLPQGYTATELSSANPPIVGVDVARNDNNVLWRYVPLISLQGQVGVNDVIASQVNEMFTRFNFNGDFTVLCSRTAQQDFGGVQLTFGARLIEFGQFTGLVWTNLTTTPSLGFTQVSISVSVAPTAEFDFEVFNTFLPISFQLLVIDDDVRDSDLDGTPDNQDNFPFDPDRQ